MARKIKVTRFWDEIEVTTEVNAFLEERGYGLDDVRIQFVTSRYIDSYGGETAGVSDELFEAYITHPA